MLSKTCHVHINHMIDIYEMEKEPFRKIHRMIDLFEVIIKTHTAVMISDYFRINNLSDEIKFFLAEGLQRPSLGLWQTFTKAIVYDLAMPQIINKEQYERFLSITKRYNLKKPDVYIKETENKYVLNSHVKEKYKNNFTQKLSSKEEFFINELFIDGFYKYFFEWDEKAEKVIELRNKYAHRATPSDSECNEDIIGYEPILEKMLKAQWINETYICVFKHGKDLYEILDIEGEEQNISTDLLKKISEKSNKKIIEDRPYLVKQNGEIIILFPIMICHKLDTDENAVLFFNDLKKSKKVSMLNYPYGQYLVDENLYKLFTKVIDIDNWRKCEGSKFKNRIEELSENFIGRKDEISKINGFITEKNKGYLFIHGEPGIGKTALVSKVINELDTKDIYVLPYFVNGANSYSAITNFLDELISWLSKYDIIISKAETDNEKIKNIENGLKNLSERLGNKKMIIFIDGIDEFKEKNGDKYIDYLLGDEYENILIVYSCRETKEVQEFYNRIKNNLKQTMVIGKLDENDIWQILSSRSNKYQLTQKHLNIITERSKGNPFYIELLCISLENGNNINDIVDKLPDNIEQWFKEFIDKYTENELGKYILSTIDVFATAKESINSSFIYKVLSENFNGECEERKVNLALDILKEVLIEDKNKDTFFYLFHESFREYLNNVRRDSILDCNDNIISLCENWKKYKRKSFNTYIARFYAVHLYENDILNEIIELSEDEDYRKFQIAATGNNTATMELYKLALESATNLEKDDKVASTALNKIKCENEYKLDVIKMLESIDYKNYKNLLNIITNFGQKEEIIIYINLLNHSLFKLKNLDQMKEMTKEILSHIEKNLIEDVTIVNILDFIPMYYLVKVMAKIKEVDLKYTIIIKRMEYKIYLSSLGINIRHYNGIVIEQVSWIETADLNKWECEIIDEIKKTMTGIQNELKSSEEFQIVQNEENERKESKELILEKLIYEKDIQKILDYVNNEDEYLRPETVYMTLHLWGSERLNDKIIDAFINNKLTKSSMIYFLITNMCKDDIKKAYSYFKLLDDIKEKEQILPHIISGFLRNNNSNQAEQLFKEYESVISEITFNKIRIIEEFMEYFYTRKDINKLIQYYEKIEYDEGTAIGYIIDLYIKEGDLKKAEDILIQQYKLHIIRGNGMNSYCNLIEALVLNLGIQNCQNGVKLVLNYINEDEVKYRILRNLVDIFIQQDQFEAFFDYLNNQLLSSDRVINNLDNINEYIVEKYYENHKEQEGKKIIMNMLEAANKSKDIDIKIDEYKSIALLLCRIKEYEWFEKLLNEIEKYILELDNPLKRIMFSNQPEKENGFINSCRMEETIINEIIKQIDLTNDLELIMILVDFLKNTCNILKRNCFNNFEKAIKIMIKLKRIEISENLIKFIDGKVEEHRYKEYVYHKIKTSNLYFEISNVKEGNQILEYLFEHAKMREYSIQDCYYILEEMKQRNISGIHELEFYFNEKMQKEEVRGKIDIFYRLNTLYYGNDIEQNKIKMNLEEMCRLIKENMNINYDSKYIYQLVEFRELEKVQEIINIKKEKIKSLESRWSKENNKILIKELSYLLKIASKIHDFKECFLFNKKINEYIKKTDEGNFELYTVRQSYDESKVELMKELLKTENVSLIFEYDIEIQVKGNDNELFQLLNSTIMKISDEKALKLLDYINIVLYNLNISEFASELYINNKKEIALKLLEKQKNRYKCECFSKIISHSYYSKKNIGIVFELCNLCEKSEDEVWLLSKAAEYIDKKMLEKYVEDINCNKKLSNYVKENAFCEIVKKIKVVDLNLVRKIISFGINNNEILTRYIILYLTAYNSNQETDKINLDKLYNYIGISN